MRSRLETLWKLCVGPCVGFLIAVLLLWGKEMEWPLPSHVRMALLELTGNHSASVNASVNEYAKIIEATTTTLAVEMAKRVRIFCWIATHKDNHATRAIHVKATWAQRCNNYVFISSENDPSLPAIKLDEVPDGREHLWEKTTAAFMYAYHNHIEDYDWFMRVDDDTYVVVENLRFALMPLDPDQPLYYGIDIYCPHRPERRYMQGGCYVLSRAALKAMVERGLNDSSKCDPGVGLGQDEDRGMGDCLRNLNIGWGDGRDAQGHHRFLPGPPEWLLGPEILADKEWVKQCAFYPLAQGIECCGDHAISFHYTSVTMMYVLDYFIYRFRNPCGGQEGGVAIPIEEVAQRLLETYALAVDNMGPEDPFKSNVSQQQLNKPNELPAYLLDLGE